METQSNQGLVVLPDISGFTEFISEVELLHGEHIIADLLECLIASNTLGLELSEIEGDALLYYRLGPPPTLEELLKQMKRWFNAFHNNLNLLRRDVYCRCGTCQNLGNLKLKGVAHYGELGVHPVGGRPKLFGKANILAHRLLKNSITCEEYLLFSSDIMAVLETGPKAAVPFQQAEETYEVLGTVRLEYLDLDPWYDEVPPVPAVEERSGETREFEVATEIHAPLASVVSIISDPNRLMEWVVGLKAVEVNPAQPVRAGHHHVCVFDGMSVDQTLERAEHVGNKFRMAVRIKPPKILLKSMTTHSEATQTGECVHLRMRTTYSPRPVFGWLFERKVRPMLATAQKASLDNLKSLIESGKLP